MTLLELNACTCESCSEKFNTTLYNARQEWIKGNREVKINHTEDYDVPVEQVIVNGIIITNNGEQADTVLSGLFEFLQIDVKVEEEWENEDY